ncbi:MAG: alpha-D-ribose 1-methylphosphonate 5-triphosphate diphosphatase [Thalassovita sp.]
MTRILPPVRLTGATILRDQEMQDRSIVIADGHISKGPFPAVDLTGYYVLPGIIDLHGDAFERHITPGPSAPFPLTTALLNTDREAAANGVTTAWLAQSWSWEGGIRSPDSAMKLLNAISAYRAQALTDMRVQIRYETHMIETGDRLIDAVRAHKLDYVVFNNHLEKAVEIAQANPAALQKWAQSGGKSPERFLELVRDRLSRGPEVPRHLCRLAETFDELGVQYGSHDDPDAETREGYAMIGARICEFPTARGPAAAARAMSDPVLMGASNVVRGASLYGNVPATQLIRDRLVSALVSDASYPSLARAVFRLVQDGVLTLPRAWALISANPAQIMRLPDRGVIDYGKRADLVVVNKRTQAIEATIARGRLTYLAGEAAQRFIDADQPLRMAAE